MALLERCTTSSQKAAAPMKKLVILQIVPPKQGSETPTEVKREPVTHRAVELTGCDICHSYFESTETLSEHRKSVHDEGPSASKDLTATLSKRQPKCNICNAFFMTKSNLLRHLNNVHAMQVSKASKNSEDSLKCGKCSDVFVTKDELTKHLEEEHGIDGRTEYKDPYECELCHETFSFSNQLILHLRDEHQKDAQGREIIVKQVDGKRMIQCDICDNAYSNRQGLYRHRRVAHKIGGPDKGVCHRCGIACSLNNLAAHIRTCGSKNKPLRRRQDCCVENCGASFYKKEHLIGHFKNVHGLKVEPMRTMKFKNVEEFKSWKLDEEDRTYSYFSKHAGTKTNQSTYYCQREGTAKSHRSATDRHEVIRRNKKGRVKTGNVCTAYLRVNAGEDGVIAYYWPTHNHPLSPDDVKHQPMSSEIIKFIKEQIALNVPNRQIQAMVKKRNAENPTTRRDAQISLKRITSLSQRYHRQLAKEGSTQAPAETFTSFIEALAAQEDSPVLFYQPPSEEACLGLPNNEEHLFFVALQTSDQQKMLQRGIAMPMFISCAKADYTFGYYLISILVPCERNFEYPVAHLMTSQLNDEVICFFLQTIGERCPELNVNCIVSIDCPEINSAIRKVFGDDGPYFLSKWHFLEFMRNEFLKEVPSNKVEEIFDFILAMADAETEDRFLLLYNTLKEQYEPDFPNVTSDFAEYFVKAGTWASCYRQGPGIIDSCMYADSFFNKLNKKYRRRPIKSINVVPDLLLYLQEGYRERRENQESNLENEISLVAEQHQLSLEIPSDLVQETLSHHWTVQNSKHAQAFLVMLCAPKCVESDCQIKCDDCVNLCSHRYFCNCGRSETICCHIHKVHQQYGHFIETECVQQDSEETAMDACSEAVNVIIEHGEDADDGSYSAPCSPTNYEPEVTDEETLGAVSKQLQNKVTKQLEDLKTKLESAPVEMLHVIQSTLESLNTLLESGSSTGV
ncbi:uncharacterized protein LOC117643281 [Thrips palmi]|uniref:Uncharacterized protein LOC117643281 n=1 Tax=Thrips palmi TaxID=161013 RepID=A0A6P8YM87_THRPL|nr:uncharacterized protein LOC117643281 [Thrips palmi]XP_034237966.1 uncharacterized protein LOC117643281 [Thrips palmi]